MSVECGGEFLVTGVRVVVPRLCQTQYGHTALMLAVEWDRIDSVRALLDAGADVDVESNVRITACGRSHQLLSGLYL